MEKFYVVFINYNSGDQLYKGVVAVLESSTPFGIIVVDNASSDNSLGYLKKIKENKKITIFRNSRNVGFYKALNIAIKKALILKAERVMILDFDLDFSFDFITQMAKVDADIVAPVLKFKKKGKWQYDYGGRINWVTGSASHLIKKSEMKRVASKTPSFKSSDPNRYDFVSGGCTIIKKEVFKKIGYFDEDYFVYFGDAQYVLLAVENGFRVVLDRRTIVHHKYEIASVTRNYRKLRITFFDNLTFIRKRIKWYFRPISYIYIIYASIRVLSRSLLSTGK